jgi:hypothetical protein
MVNTVVAAKSAWKTVVTSFFMALGMVIAGAVAQFLSDGEALAGILGTNGFVLALIPLFGALGAFIKDYVKHA